VQYRRGKGQPTEFDFDDCDSVASAVHAATLQVSEAISRKYGFGDVKERDMVVEPRQFM